VKAFGNRYEIFLVLSAAVWGTSFVTIKLAYTSGIDPVFFAFMRFAVGTIAIMAVVFWMKRFDAKVMAQPMIILCALLNALSFALQNTGMASTSATNSVLLVNTNVGIVAILAAIYLSEALTYRILIGIFMGMVGVLFISTNGDLSAIYSGTFWGNILVLAAGWVWAFYIVFQKRNLQRNTDVLMVTGAIISETMLFLIPMTLLLTPSFSFAAEGWIAILYIGLACTFAANLLYNAGLQGTKASVSSIILLLEIVFAMIFAVILLGEIPTIVTAMGGGLILLSIALISFSNGNKNEIKNGIKS
jgi:drug/metabolite transporter (DMT)-like permease